MIIDVPFEIGDLVYEIIFKDKEFEKCKKCEGRGNVNRRDDWYGGWESVQCYDCKGQRGHYYEIIPYWMVVEKPKTIKRFDVYKDEVKLVFAINPYWENDESYLYSCFKNKEDAEKECKERNKLLELARVTINNKGKK